MTAIVRRVIGIATALCGIPVAMFMSSGLSAQTPIHLLGFVERLCPQEPYCFDFRVKPEYVDQVGAYIRVRFAAAQQIYDPENYELTLEQQNIVTGSHLRLLIDADPRGADHEYLAQFIWIGD